ncbi:PRADC1-like protein isoform X2 [Colias croceus]|uniref:PRADC1-like protein isoform X2 n=1 Tax=Colias crocea TaxID=72248 RepID=UPI001E27D6B9|nr:PRADC1-like protein isoform X2 [Colias croceus]
MFSNKYTKLSYVVLFTALFFSFLGEVSPGANDLHFHDGSTSADVIGGDVFFEILEPPELRYSYRIRPAKDFGGTFNSTFRMEKARLVPTDPINSCSDISNSEEVDGNIALAERGDCSFVFKTAVAQIAGARAIIITESIHRWDDSLDHLIEMVDDKMQIDVNIPSAFLLGRNGATIIRTLKKLHLQYAVINIPVNMTYIPINKMNQPPWITW